MPLLPMSIPAAALDLQRRFAGHVLTLRGGLRNADARRPEQDELELDVPESGEVQEGQEVRVVGEFPSAPVAAFVGRQSMQVRAELADDGGAKVFLKIPAGFQGGDVQLRWPTRSILAKPPLQLKKVSAFQRFHLLQREGAPGDWIKIGNFGYEPVEVQIGGETLASADFKRTDGVLSARVPLAAQRGPVLVVTADNLHHPDRLYHQSIDFFEPKSSKRAGEPGSVSPSKLQTPAAVQS